uniref:DUF1772 domain-containing protein n=1 Tax=OCS116 cluster bacterium TaxID=2030921 RepID=A0A2A4YYF2_9PROT
MQVAAAIIACLSGLGLALVVGVRLLPEAGWQLPFDLRFFGYSFETAEGYLTAITPLGRDWYGGPFRVLDTLFPLSVGLWLSLLALRRGRGLAASAAAGAATLFAAADLSENYTLMQLMAGPLPPDAALVVQANFLTMAKYGLILLAFVLLAKSWVVKPQAKRGSETNGK